MAAAITFKITAAGRAALRNADGNGTNAVLVASVGITATAFTSGDALPDEIKRLTTIKGGATAADTIHVSISDDTQGAVYEVRGYGLYLQDGTLLGSYGQADVLVQKSAQAAMLLSADIQFADIDATQITFGDTNFSNPAATTDRMGVVELATSDETTAGTDATRAITPKGLLAALNARLGAGAPSDFVKTLLGIAQVAAFRVALGIKSAATFDTGADNGLDADKLDGQHGAYYLRYENLTNVPTSFPPSPHTHAAGDITSGIFPVPRGGTGLGTVPAGYFLVGAANGVDAMVPRSPAQVRADIQAAAASHSHAIGDVIGLQDALDGKAAKVHTHVIGDVTNLQTTLDAKAPVASPTFTGEVQSKLGPLSNVATSVLEAWNLELTGNTNRDRMRWVACRSTTGPGWNTSFWRLTRGVDSTDQGFIDFGGGDANLGFAIRFGLGNTQAGYVDSSNRWWFATKVQFAATDNVFSDTAPFQFTGMGANQSMYWHGTNGPGDNWLQVTRAGSSSYTTNFFGSVVATGGFQWSDRRLKKDIARKTVTRGLALNLARKYSSWTMKADGSYGEGIVAQDAKKHAPSHVSEHKYGKRAKRLVVDKPGLALEAACDNALAIEELIKRIEKLERTTA